MISFSIRSFRQLSLVEATASMELIEFSPPREEPAEPVRQPGATPIIRQRQRIAVAGTG